jgi:anti-anti-sigma factor
MLAPRVRPAPVVVTFPAEIDLASQEQAYGRLYAAVASGAPVVVADLSATTFCDCASLRRLVTVHNDAAAHGAELRLVIAPGGAVRRLADLVGLDRRLWMYSSLPEAAGPQAGGHHHPGRSTRLRNRKPAAWGRAIRHLIG